MMEVTVGIPSVFVKPGGSGTGAKSGKRLIRTPASHSSKEIFLA
jgi:hypothetical protein